MIISNVNKTTKTPINSTIITSLISILILFLFKNMENIAIFHNIFIMFTLIIINATSFKLSNCKSRSIELY